MAGKPMAGLGVCVRTRLSPQQRRRLARRLCLCEGLTVAEAAAESELAARRLEQEIAQGRLWEPPELAAPKQGELFDPPTSRRA